MMDDYGDGDEEEVWWWPECPARVECLIGRQYVRQAVLSLSSEEEEQISVKSLRTKEESDKSE